MRYLAQSKLSNTKITHEPFFGALKASRAVLSDDGEAICLCKLSCLSLSHVEKGTNDPDVSSTIQIMSLHGPKPSIVEG
jgi:hypothetical protein